MVFDNRKVVNGRCRALVQRVSPRDWAEAGLFLVLVGMTALSAALVKESRSMPTLASVTPVTVPEPVVAPVVYESASEVEIVEIEPTPREVARAERIMARQREQVRWFNGRPVRPARLVWMQVTAYSPDERSCGEFADGLTATLHPVETNAGHLVAADTRIFPFGTMVSVEGYADDNIVPVLDRGGAIKGYELDLLMPTHRQAMRWGVKRMPVVIWEFADGEPMEDPRKFR